MKPSPASLVAAVAVAAAIVAAVAAAAIVAAAAVVAMAVAATAIDRFGATDKEGVCPGGPPRSCINSPLSEPLGSRVFACRTRLPQNPPALEHCGETAPLLAGCIRAGPARTQRRAPLWPPVHRRISRSLMHGSPVGVSRPNSTGAARYSNTRWSPMNPTHYYHTPIKPVSTRVSCPVCHQAVYSRAGIHPQCAVIQQDPPRLRSRKQPAHALPDQAAEILNENVEEEVAKPSIVARNVHDRPGHGANGGVQTAAVNVRCRQ